MHGDRSHRRPCLQSGARLRGLRLLLLLLFLLLLLLLVLLLLVVLNKI